MESLKNLQKNNCRLCDQQTEKMYSIFDKNDTGQQILHLIMELLPIVVYRRDPLSKRVCEDCLQNLNTLTRFKRTCKGIAEKHIEDLRTNGDTSDKYVQLYLTSQDESKNENDISTRLTDAITSTDDLTVHCSRCKQSLLDCNTTNGEIELCMELQTVYNSKLNDIETDKARNKRKKPQPFYHDMDDSICSTLTEFTTTESSQGCEIPSDIESSIDSEHDGQRPLKRIKLEPVSSNLNNGLLAIKNSIENHKSATLLDSLKAEVEYIYNPLSLLQLIINSINVRNLPDYEVDHFSREPVQIACRRCSEQLENVKLLAIHEARHLDVDLGERIDGAELWEEEREFADVRNKWFNCLVEKQTDYEEVDMELEADMTELTSETLLVPINTDDVEMKEDFVPETQRITLVGERPFVMGIPLHRFSKEERKTFYQTIRVGNRNCKFCHLCRYSFKDSWAIESHYFSGACFYTCKYCGMRYNKQRMLYEEHVEAHIQRGDLISDRTFAANKSTNFVPKEATVPPPVVKTSKPEKSKKAAPPPPTAQKATNRRVVKEVVKEEPPKAKIKQEKTEIVFSHPKKNNQAYFCRKCYKVFFKLDEFTQHSRKCDYNQMGMNKFNSTATKSPGRPKTVPKATPAKPVSKTVTKTTPNNAKVVKPRVNLNVSLNGDSNTIISPSGRPVRNCVKEVTYKEDENINSKESNSPSSSSTASTAFTCYTCNASFSTVYARNSHMRIHKGDRIKSPVNNVKSSRQLQIKEEKMDDGYEVKVKQEPIEPMVEIYESEEMSLGCGAVSITPIVKNPNKKPTINPNIMKLVQNNPNLTIKKSPEKSVGNISSSSSIGSNSSNNLLDERSYKCSSCGENFMNKSHLYFHKKNACEGSRFPCPFCKKRFGTETAYSSHIFYSHPE